ncbi:hypothetical protein CJF30_00004010 [Rutstroemia sp. NJR-2017a BBW]|nr:hypothetical protein CJF30_00004010 [Rutstroemia sp. NJR-2017a BBW]
MSTGNSSGTLSNATCILLGRYSDVVESQSRFADNPEVFAQFRDFIETFQSQEDDMISLSDLTDAIEDLFSGHYDLLDNFYALLPGFKADVESHRKQTRRLQKREALLGNCRIQTESPLLRLPREIRDNIWSEVVSGNIAHVHKDPASREFRYHQCVAANGFNSSVCPPGTGDHAECSVTGPSSFAGFRRICKQITLELPDLQDAFFSGNALQFSDLEDAEQYLFALEEPDRAAIAHLRLPVPRQVWAAEGAEAELPTFKAWEHINNYFSCPWDRASLRVDVERDRHYLKQPCSLVQKMASRVRRYKLGHKHFAKV